MGHFSESNGNENFVGTDSKHVTAVIEELRKEFKNRLAGLKVEFVASKSKQQQVLAASMAKLPKSVKSMSIREFNALYKCDLISMVQAVREDEMSKKRVRDATETPAPTRQGGMQLQAAPRTVRRGEAVL